jgi:hypothetical protein
MTSWLPSRAELARERERRYAAALRACLEALGRADWPPWPPEADVDHHAWVRAHWTIEASDRFDTIGIVNGDLEWARLRVLAQDLLDLGEDRDAIRARIATDSHRVWDEIFAGDWWAWIEANWPQSRLEALRRELDGARTSLAWLGDNREQLRQGERAEVVRLEGLVPFDLSEQEMKPYLERRVCGIRGRYRLMYTVWERRHGITEANIDAP